MFAKRRAVREPIVQIIQEDKNYVWLVIEDRGIVLSVCDTVMEALRCMTSRSDLVRCCLPASAQIGYVVFYLRRYIGTFASHAEALESSASFGIYGNIQIIRRRQADTIPIWILVKTRSAMGVFYDEREALLMKKLINRDTILVKSHVPRDNRCVYIPTRYGEFRGVCVSQEEALTLMNVFMHDIQVFPMMLPSNPQSTP